MPLQSGLVCQHVGRVAHDLQAFGGRLHHNAARGVGDDPVQQRNGEAAEPLVHQRDVGQRALHIVNACEVRAHPQRELVRRHGGGARARRFGEVRVAGEVQPGDGQAVLVGAVEVQREVVGRDGHTHNGAVSGVGGVVARRERDGLAVAVRPVKVAAEIQVAVRVGESNGCAHRFFLSA